MNDTLMPRRGEDLEQAGYTLFKAFAHQDLVAFILPYTKRKNIYMNIYKIGMLLPFSIFFGTLGYLFGSGAGIKEHLGSLIYYAGAVVLLIPIHELIHGIAYKWVGAPKVSYGVIWKQLAFFAQADNFVVNFREFRWLALAPFAVISFVLLVAMLLSDISGWLGCSLLMGLHNGLCAGDFALLSFFYENRDRNLVTYDSAADNTTYFYEKKEVGK